MTLKNYFANEIMSAFAAQMNDSAFTGLYKKAEAQPWWEKGPTAKAFKDEVDAAKTAQEVDMAQNKYLAGGELTTKLAQEGIDDHTELRNYAEDAAGKKTQAADDKGCPEHVNQADDTCPKCMDAGTAIAADFAIRHMVKIADALDHAGYSHLAGILDESLQKLAALRPMIVIAKKKGRTANQWIAFLSKQSKKEAAKFAKTYKGALEQAKKKGMKAKKAEEYAMKVALDGVNKKYLEEPTPEHGKGKSGPLTTKRSK